MRRSYGRALRRLARRTPNRLFALALKALDARIRPGLCPPLVPPIVATLSVTARCNLDCDFCPTHRRGAAGTPQSDPVDLVDRLADLGVDALGLTGGEPLLHPQVESAIARAVSRGVFVHLNTNGTLVDAARATALLETGVGSINVSLDAGCKEPHDAQRGEGAFDRAIEGVACLLAARRRLGADTGLRLVMTLGARNASSVDGFLELGRTMGVDGCSFIPLHTSFVSPRRNASHRAAEAVTALIGAAPSIVDNSRAYLHGMRSFFLGCRLPRRCSALRTSIVVDSEGALFPCVPAATAAATLRKGSAPVIGRTKSLDHIFKSGSLRDTLDPAICSTCWWNCHRELDIGLGIL